MEKPGNAQTPKPKIALLLVVVIFFVLLLSAFMILCPFALGIFSL